MKRSRPAFADLLFAAAFVAAGALVWWRAHPAPIGPLLARQAALLDRAEKARGDLAFLPPPSSPAEAEALRGAWRQFQQADGPGQWGALRAAVARRGKPAAVAAFNGLWSGYEAARQRWEAALAALALPESPEPGLAIKHTEDYVEATDRFQEADGALSDWVARLSPDDFQ